MKLTKPKPTPAPYVPNGLVKCTVVERRNSWNDSTLTEYLKGQMDEQSFCRERLERARFRQQQCESLVKQFREIAEDWRDAKKLGQLERDLMEAKGDVMFALGQLDCAEETAA